VNPRSPEESGAGANTDRAPETMGTAALRIADEQAADDGLDHWVTRARAGESGAYERVYRACVPRIHALCLRMTGSQQEAEELTQDVFVRAWQRLGSFRGESLFTTWLHRLAVNLVLQERRASGRRRSRERSEPEIEAFGHAAVAAMPGTRVDLERAIAGLPEGARKMLVLRDVQGYRYQEIAKLTGVSLGTVKAQIHRARALMREALER
jgi:RNA polymerase sigma-70 factor (ECF subfamily)